MSRMTNEAVIESILSSNVSVTTKEASEVERKSNYTILDIFAEVVSR